MPLSWNEIRQRAITFARAWRHETRERAERQTFWNEFFGVFGIERRAVATFEEPVRKLSGNWGAIDLFWPGKVLVEHKSAGADLDKAHAQGMEYIRGLQDSGRQGEIPRLLIVSDFRHVALHDLEPENDPEAPLFNRLPPSVVFPLTDLHKNIRHFAFIAGYTPYKLNPESPANLEATELMCKLHDALADGGYKGHELKRFLVRVLFCLFSEDNGIFPQKAFELYVRDRTAPDGSDLGARLEQLFRVLNTPAENRQTHLDEDLRQFPFINGELFAERLEFADFNQDMRNGLLACCGFRWERISPAVFGSLFQSVMDASERRRIGAHYTAEKNILKLIRSLFLDELYAEFGKIKNTGNQPRRLARLKEFQDRLSRLRFLDPACGCGNFLVLTYRELRKLELEVLIEIHGRQQEMSLDEANRLSKLDVHQFYGIEIEEFPARIAEVALWLTDHQANIALSETFSQLVLRLPLRSSPRIVVGNALRLDWRNILPAGECGYVLGNPPFVGKQYMTVAQKDDMKRVCGHVKGSGVLDYVTAWYFKAAEYAAGTPIRCAFVSTNSISQGEQPGILWGELFGRYGMKIHFAHRTFPWESEARGKAHVHVVIIGFGAGEAAAKTITDYETDIGHAAAIPVANINPYLVAGGDVALPKRSTPICPVPEMAFGSMPNDGGHLLLDQKTKEELLRFEPAARKFIRPFVGAEEFINGIERWCLWLVDASPSELKSMPEVMRRIQAVKAHRQKSARGTTNELAKTPAIFGEIRQPRSTYILVPRVSSERRPYIPIAFSKPRIIAGDAVLVIPKATLYHFGILTSRMHMAWMRQTAGRLESRYRYSAGLVYNNFPWPPLQSKATRDRIMAAAKAILSLRDKYAISSLADLYDPDVMPPELVKAHAALDRLVDRCYQREPFPHDRARVEHLFRLYEHLTAPIVATANGQKKRSRGGAAV